MKKTLQFFSILILFQFNSYAQRIVKDDCIGTNKNDSIIMSHENDDSTFTIIYSEQIPDSALWNESYYRLKVVKLDKDQNIIIDKYIDDKSYFVTNTSNLITNSIKNLAHFQSDGSFMIVYANKIDTNNYFYFSAYDKHTNFKWNAIDSFSYHRYYAEPTNKSYVAKKPNGGFIVLAVCKNPFVRTQAYNIISLSASGQVEWTNTQYYSLGYGVELVSAAIIPKQNHKTFLHLDIGDVSVVYGYTGVLRKNMIIDSAGITTNENFTYTRPSYVDYFEQYIDEPQTYSVNNFSIYYLQDTSSHFMSINTDNLSIVKHDSTIATSFYTYYIHEDHVTDSTHNFFYPVDFSFVANRYVTCRDMNNNIVWNYNYIADSSNSITNYQKPEIIDNNTIYIDNRLVRNGIKIWQSDIKQYDTITYNGQMAISNEYHIFKSKYDNQHLNISRTYETAFGRIIMLDVNTGNIVQDYFIDYDKATNINYLRTLDDRTIFAANTNYNNCRLNGSNVYLATYSAEYNTIIGTAYIDTNNNNFRENNEPIYPYGYAITTNTIDTQIQHLSATQLFKFYTNTGSYTTKLQLYNDYYTIAPAQFVTSHNTFDNIDTLLFALHPKPNKNDMCVSLVNNWMTRLGQSNDYTISLANKGTTYGNGKVKLLMDARLLSVTTTPTYSYKNGDTIVWNVVNSVPNTIGTVTIHFTAETPTALNAGDTIISKAWFESDSIDLTPIDNYAEVKEMIRASYDPNEKNITSGETLTQAQIANGAFISYVVHFENKGNDTAFKVIIIDTLSEKVDVKSLQIINASHPYTLEIINGKILKFTFENIRLSYDSTNTTSKGYIAYKIKTRTDVTVVNTIDNTANIFFDYNQPIRTNTAQAKILIATTTNQNKNSNGKINVYPNPNNGIFTIRFESKNTLSLQLELIDVTGNIIYSETKNHQSKTEFTINETNLPKGIYFIKLNDGNNIYSNAIVMQ